MNLTNETTLDIERRKPAALSLLASERPRDVGWLTAAGLLFGDWGTSRLYVLGLALFFAGRTSFWLIVAMSGLILAVAWAYSVICPNLSRWRRRLYRRQADQPNPGGGRRAAAVCRLQ